MFSEVAFADDKLAAQLGMKFGDREFQQLILFRNYEKNLPTWHGNAFSAQSNFDNETGIYYGAKLLLNKKTKINCYFDLWSFPRTRYFEKMPTIGSDHFFQFETRFTGNTVRLTVHNKQKEKYMTLETAEIRDFERLLIRCDWWQKLKDVTFKTRSEFVSEYLPDDHVYGKGLLFYEQLKVDYDNFDVVAQISFYKSVLEPFKIKHYMYENNITGIMQNSVLSGDGIASYLLIRLNVTSNLKLQVKISDRWLKKNEMRLFFQIINKW